VVMGEGKKTSVELPAAMEERRPPDGYRVNNTRKPRDSDPQHVRAEMSADAGEALWRAVDFPKERGGRTPSRGFHPIVKR